MMKLDANMPTKVIEGITFHFMYAFGYEGVLIDIDSMDVDAPNLVSALREAKRLQMTYRAMAAFFNTVLRIQTIKFETDDQLSEWRAKAVFAITQDDWGLNTEEKGRVQDFIDAIDEELSRRALRIAKPSKPAVPGYVYVVKSPTGAYKIGKSKDPDNRLRTFSVKLPFEVEYVCVIPTDDMNGLERDLHSRFSDKRENGEWFNLTDTDIQYIKALNK